MPGFDIDALLAERAWVGRVARTLVHGDAEAEDLEQRAWMRALGHPPSEAPRSPRGWLRTVLRFAAIDGIRERAARRRHEAAAASLSPERSDASPHALVARAEVLERLVHAVLALDEPYRGTVLLRYFEELPPREIARRQGVPVETVRTRIKRALERLRTGLGGDGGREGLLAIVAPLLRFEGESAIPAAVGGAIMGTAAKVGLAAGVLILTGGGVVAWRASSGTPESPMPSAPSAARVVAAPPVAADPPPVFVPPAPPDAPPEAAKEPGPSGPSIEERLEERPDEVKWEGHSVGTILEDLSRRLRLEPMPEYESEDLRRAAYGTSIECVGFTTVAYRVMLVVVVGYIRSPVWGGKVPHWEVRKDRLFVFLRDPPPPKAETPEEVKKREENANAFLEFLRTEKTSLVFDGQPLESAFSYLSARHRINVLTDEAVRERVNTLAVKLTLTDVPLAEAFDELLRIDPDLTWEVVGNLKDAKWSIVRIRRR